MQRGDDRESVAGIRGAERRDTRVSVGRRLDESVLLQPSYRLSDGRPAETEPLRDLRVLELLTRLERSVEDGVSQAHVRLISQQRPRRLGRSLRNWHVKYYISDAFACQDLSPPHLKAGEHVARCGRAHPRTELIAICDLRDVRVGAPGGREAGERGVSARSSKTGASLRWRTSS